MVQLMLDELPRADPEIALHHVNLRLSQSGRDIGRWQPGKAIAARRVIRQARATIARHHCDTLYYVPAPGKRIALWRDLMLLRSIRPTVPRLVLHWHASGLGHWLENKAMTWERHAATRWLGRADLAIALAPSLVPDIEIFSPQRTAIVPNGVRDPFEGAVPPDRSDRRDDSSKRILFLGLGSEAKGLFRTIDALDHLPANYSLTFAGEFPDGPSAEKFSVAKRKFGDRISHAGFVDATTRRHLLADHDVLAFPTTYEHEAFPLVLIEALAADLPVVTTRWRAIPELMPAEFTHFADPHSRVDLARQIESAVNNSIPGQNRTYFENHYTREQFRFRLAKALSQVPGPA